MENDIMHSYQKFDRYRKCMNGEKILCFISLKPIVESGEDFSHVYHSGLGLFITVLSKYAKVGAAF